MYRVLICDDHPVARAGLRAFLETDPLIRSVGECATTTELLASVRALAWDLVVLDICMPGRSGIDAIKDIRSLSEGTRILMVSFLPDSQMAIPVLRAGADGYLSKADDPRGLLMAVHRLMAGKRYVSSPVTEVLAANLDEARDRAAEEQLTPREFAVLAKLASGRSLRAIADDLGICLKTVRDCRTRILRKMRFNYGRYPAI